MLGRSWLASLLAAVCWVARVPVIALVAAPEFAVGLLKVSSVAVFGLRRPGNALG